MTAAWKIMAGEGGRYIDNFLETSRVAVALDEATDFCSCRSKEEIASLVRERLPLLTNRQVSVAASQHWRFLSEVQVGDVVLVYASQTRLYHQGVVASSAEFTPECVPQLPVTRQVAWHGTVERDRLSQSAKNSLGAILTIFKVPEQVVQEIRRFSQSPEGAAHDLSASPVDDAVEPDPFAGIEQLALDRITDRISALSWDEMQELVASLLRALGYRTVISPDGPDRGKDIVASRDGFGFERPRIVVEVKHRRGQMGAQEIRSFLGGRHADDRGLYVSTGGFSREARYEAERAATVTHLMTLEELARAIVEQYDRLDQQGKRLVPLTKLYWPA